MNRELSRERSFAVGAANIMVGLMILRNHDRRPQVVVVIPDQCRQAGAHEEYPEGWLGKRVAIKDQPTERLQYVQFDKPFIGRNVKGDPARKTDQDNGMLIPECLLIPAPIEH